jgi:hypothetical protein
LQSTSSSKEAAANQWAENNAAQAKKSIEKGTKAFASQLAVGLKM